MSIHSNAMEQVLINQRKLVEQQKEQRTLKNGNKILNQTLFIKVAESVSPIFKKPDEYTKKTSEVIKESNSDDDIKSNIIALPNSSRNSTSMREMIVSLMNSLNSLKITQDESGRACRCSYPNIRS